MQKKVHRKLNKKALLVIVLTLYLFIMAFYYCFNLPIKSIVIKGNTNTLDEEIIKLGNINSYNKILGLNTKKVKNDIMENKAITSVKIKKQLNGTLLINVKEQNILFYNLLYKVYVYGNGKTSENVSNKLGIPTLINYTPSDIYDNLIKKLNNINIDILKKVSEIEYSPDIKNEKVIDKNRFLLRMNDGNYIYINLANMDNLNKYEEIYATLNEKQKGILNLDSTSKGVVFQPFDLIKEKEEKKDELSK
jgi:cell division protein